MTGSMTNRSHSAGLAESHYVHRNVEVFITAISKDNNNLARERL